MAWTTLPAWQEEKVLSESIWRSGSYGTLVKVAWPTGVSRVDLSEAFLSGFPLCLHIAMNSVPWCVVATDKTDQKSPLLTLPPFFFLPLQGSWSL